MLFARAIEITSENRLERRLPFDLDNRKRCNPQSAELGGKQKWFYGPK